ncbi:MAG: porin [Candidatus Aminicenantaceae bacterium]
MRRKKFFMLIFCLVFLAGTSAEGKSGEEVTPSSDPPVKLSGYNQVRYTYQEEGFHGFRIRRARVRLKGDLLEDITYTLQVDVTQSPILLDAHVGIDFVSQAKLSFGQFKVPFSLENLTSSSALDTINRSLTVEKLCPGRDIGSKGRDIGVAIKGRLSEIEYTVGIFNGSGINKTDDNDRKDIAGRFVFHLFRNLSFGLSYYNGRYGFHPGDPAVKRNRSGIDIIFVQQEFSIKGEYIFARDDQTEKYGWYLQGGYFIMPEKIQAIVRYDSFDKNKDTREDRIDVIIFGMNWFFSNKTKFQINYEYHKGESEEDSGNVILVQFQAGF